MGPPSPDGIALPYRNRTTISSENKLPILADGAVNADGMRKAAEEAAVFAISGRDSLADKQVRMAYLVSQYPGISHTFVLREVVGLRQMGFDIQVASINPPDRSPKNLTGEEYEEWSRTLYVKKCSLPAVLALQLQNILRNPARYLAALAWAVKLGRADRKRRFLGFFYFAEATIIARWMRQHRLNHLHVHFATPASTVGVIVSKLSAASLSITVHGPDEFYDVTRYQLAEKIEACRFLCVIGKFARSQLMKLSAVEHWSKFEVTPLGVDPKRFSARPKNQPGEPVQHAGRQKDAGFEILCVGRLVPSKGQHILIQACARLVQQGEDVCLRLVGDGPDRRSLEQLAVRLGIARKVFFEGSVNQDKILQFYHQADVFVLASFAEGIPVVLMEAMAMEVPCISTRITGIPELIRDGKDGLLVTASDDEELASAIRRLIQRPELSRTLGAAGRCRVLSCYDLLVNVRHLADVFRRRLEA